MSVVITFGSVPEPGQFQNPENLRELASRSVGYPPGRRGIDRRPPVLPVDVQRIPLLQAKGQGLKKPAGIAIEVSFHLELFRLGQKIQGLGLPFRPGRRSGRSGRNGPDHFLP
ncbi:MAG: hypothetical protein NTV79_08320 [Candidatus Aureabacteria bacterium]|nr:hypothetical protein [Candidatus Auribacterota bacterium]